MRSEYANRFILIMKIMYIKCRRIGQKVFKYYMLSPKRKLNYTFFSPHVCVFPLYCDLQYHRGRSL